MRTRIYIACLLALGGVAGCVSNTAPSEPGAQTLQPTGAQGSPTATEAEHLARLEALDLFDVGELVERRPFAAHGCYGACPEWTAMTDDERQAALDDARAAQLARLAAFTEIAERVHAEGAPSVDVETATEHLDAIASLAIVDVGALVVTEPAANPLCYNLPCAEDIAEADAANAARAAELAVIAARSRGL